VNGVEADSFEAAIRIMRRRAVLIPLAFLAFIVLLIVSRWVVAPLPLDVYVVGLLSMFLAFPAALLVLGRIGIRRMRARLGPIRPQIRDVGVGLFRGIVLVTTEGLFLYTMGRLTAVSMFFGSGGSLIHPTADDALRWTQPFRGKQEMVVRAPWGGATGEGLEELRTASGAMVATGLVQRYAAKAVEPNPPYWVVTVTFVSMFIPTSLEWIVANASRVADYLQALIRMRLGGQAA